MVTDVMSQHCFSKWLVAWQLHYLNQCWLTISMAHWQSPDSNITRYPSHQLPRLAWKLLISLKSSRGQWDNLSNFLRNLVIHVAGIGRHVFVFEKMYLQKIKFQYSIIIFMNYSPNWSVFACFYLPLQMLNPLHSDVPERSEHIYCWHSNDTC